MLGPCIGWNDLGRLELSVSFGSWSLCVYVALLKRCSFETWLALGCRMGQSNKMGTHSAYERQLLSEYAGAGFVSDGWWVI